MAPQVVCKHIKVATQAKKAIRRKTQHLHEIFDRLLSCAMAEIDAQNNCCSTMSALLRDLEQAQRIGNRRSEEALRRQTLASESFLESVCSAGHATLREAIAARDSLIFWRDTYLMLSEAGNSSATSSRLNTIFEFPYSID